MIDSAETGLIATPHLKFEPQVDGELSETHDACAVCLPPSGIVTQLCSGDARHCTWHELGGTTPGRGLRWMRGSLSCRLTDVCNCVRAVRVDFPRQGSGFGCRLSCPVRFAKVRIEVSLASVVAVQTCPTLFYYRLALVARVAAGPHAV